MSSATPVIFLSAASVDLKDWRDHLHHAFSRAGFRVLTQEQSLRSAPGDVRRLLTDTIAEADCVIHLAGMGYGSHATEPFPEAPDFQCSWTQFEYYHAHQLKKDVIAFVCAPDLSKPGFTEKSESPAELLLKQRLQETHRQRVARGDFTGTPLEGNAARTSNENVTNSGKLMEAVAAAVGTLRGVQRADIEKAQAELRTIGDSLSRLEHGQRKMSRVVLASAALLLLIAGLVLWIRNTTGETAAAVDAVAQKQDAQTALLTDQQTLLKEAVAQLENVSREKLKLGIKIEDLPREAIYKEIAARLNVSDVELALNIEAGKKSTDALTRGRAHLLARSYDDAHKAAQEARDADKAAIQRVIQSHEIDADTYYQEIKLEQSLDSVRKIAVLTDKANDLDAWAAVQSRLGSLLHELSRYKEAETLFRDILAVREKLPGQNRADLIAALKDLAMLLHTTSDIEESESLFRRALDINEAHHGRDHPSAAELLRHLASVLQEANRHAEAEPLYHRALKIDETHHGRSHPSIAHDLAYLASLLHDTGRLTEAENMYRRALAVDEALYGPNHPAVARDLVRVARVLNDSGRATEAEPLYRRSLEINEASFGRDHHFVANGLYNLATCYLNLQRYKDAEPLLRRSLTIKEAVLGRDHPEVANSLMSLAEALQFTNRLEDASPHYLRALQILEAQYGNEHPSFAAALYNTAQAYCASGRFADAEPLSRQALEILLRFKQANGHADPASGMVLDRYCIILASLGCSHGEQQSRLRAVANAAKMPPEETSTLLASALGPFELTLDQLSPDGQAAALGMKVGDILRSYNGQDIFSALQLSAISGMIKDDAIPIEIQRGDSRLKLTAKPGSFGVAWLERRKVATPPAPPPAPPAIK